MNEAPPNLQPNLLVRHLDKSPDEFTKADLIRFIAANGIEGVNLRYVAGDGKLKTLNFVITSRAQLDRLLSAGERVDGSSLFNYLDAASSDLYVVPRFRTAFVNPFSSFPTLDLLCAYFTSDGEPLPSAPEHLVAKAGQSLRAATGLTLEAMGELEYYVFSPEPTLYRAAAQHGYHESAPFTKWEHLRIEAMKAMAQAGVRLKYGHAEVGQVQEQGAAIEQGEVELAPVPVADAADEIVLARWILRMIGSRYGVNVSFAPKVVVGHAGSGLHIHARVLRDGRNEMVDAGRLTETARRAIAGLLTLAPSLTAFGNTVPTSYLRLVPHQEAPTNICWGDRNRSVLVRVPLGWTGADSMSARANPGVQNPGTGTGGSRQTVELRSPDGSANAHLLLAGVAVAVRHGLQMSDALRLADRLYVDVNIFDESQRAMRERLPHLPASCWESAECLLGDRAIYEKDGVFTPATIDGLARELQAFADQGLGERLAGDRAAVQELVRRYLHCG